MSSQSSQPNIEIIDLTNDTPSHDKTITLDDSCVVCIESEEEVDDRVEERTLLEAIAEQQAEESSEDEIEAQDDSPRLSRPFLSQQTLIVCDDDDDDDMLDSPRLSRPFASQQARRSSHSEDNGRVGMPKLTKAMEKQQAKELREEAKRIKAQQKEEDKLLKEANRANAANKALENCTATIDKNVLTLVNDPDEEILKTLFDESMIKYKLTSYSKIDNGITWTYRRTEVVDGACISTYHDAKWIMVVMQGSEYLKKLLIYKTDPDDPQSIKTYLSDIRRRSDSDVILVIFNLAAHLKTERAKEAKNYRATFKNRFEGNQVTERSEVPGAPLTLGLTELQDARLMLQIDFNQQHTDWKLHIEFFEKKIDLIQSLVRYTLSIAKYEIKQKARTSTGLDWAINMDKERASDPTKSSEDLTKLWMTQLQQFPQVTLPIAKAIANEYPSPCALLDQYQSLTVSEAERLLAQLYVQRNLKRQVGMAISKRIHCFMTSEDPNIHIGLS